VKETVIEPTVTGSLAARSVAWSFFAYITSSLVLSLLKSVSLSGASTTVFAKSLRGYVTSVGANTDTESASVEKGEIERPSIVISLPFAMNLRIISSASYSVRSLKKLSARFLPSSYAWLISVSIVDSCSSFVSIS